MACGPALAAGTRHRIGRQWTARQLLQEAARVQAAGSAVLLLHPAAADLKIHGPNLMRPSALAAAGRAIAQSAYDQTARSLGDLRVEHFLTAVNQAA
jgi:hypothetical protein